MDELNLPSHGFDQPQICHTPYRFQVSVKSSRSQRNRLLIKRGLLISLAVLTAATVLVTIFVVPGKYKTYCEQNPQEGICQPMSTTNK